jgi:sirohydrochlorin cobaltochelatase
VEGWPGRTQLNNLAGKHTFKKALIIPFMFVAGDHIINDINGRKNSLKKELTKKFDSVETLTYSYDNKTYYMGLGFNEKVVNIFVQKLQKLIEETDD